MRKAQTNEVQGTKEEFLSFFRELCGSKTEWQVWEDIISMMADAISNSVDKTHYEKREEDYMHRVKGYKNTEVLSKLLPNLTLAYEKNPCRDYLGEIYQDLGLSSHWRGQFFTPISVCQMMAKMQLKDAAEKIEKQHWITINDPACGAGATLIVAANTLHIDYNINYQTSALFVANDIDPVTAKMCYIQLSLLGCPGYVAVADTLCDPVVGDVLSPVEKETQDFWYTPMYFSDVWVYRRVFRNMDRLFSRPPCLSCKTIEKKDEVVESYQMDISEFLAT